MNFDFTDDQQAIKRTANELLAARFKSERMRELAEAERYDDDAWKEMSELGWAGIFIDEDHGGQGLGVVELVILMEELGYALAPVPFLSNAAAGLAIQFAGTDEQKERWLPGIASGEARGTVGMLRDGEARLVPDADSAEVIVLIGSDGSTSVVEAAAAEVETFEAMDRTRRFARVRAESGEPLGGDCFAAGDRIATALSAETVGVAQKAMEMAVEYARDRKQFGRPIGSYQAVSHRLADMLWEVEEARSLTYYAAWSADADPGTLALAAHMAKARASDAATMVTHNAIQTLGGIGFTWEHDIHFFLKRARVGAELLGSAGQHRDRVAALAGLG
jgi:alkylation response protein AidB-like acyl-CoA dehydrogenase